jgi:hypothetical protein
MMVGRHTEETKNKISKALSGKNHPFYGKLGRESSFYGRHHTKEAKNKISKALSGKNNPMYGKKRSEESKKKVSGSNSWSWIGGDRNYWHRQAWSKFGKDYCEICGMESKDYKKISKRRFEMHNCLVPKNYKCMKSRAWLCLCHKCHRLAESGRRN